MSRIRIIKTLIVINELSQGHSFAYSLITQWRAKRFLTPRQWAAAESLCREQGFDTLYRPRTTRVRITAAGATEEHELPEGWPLIDQLKRQWRNGLNAPVLTVNDVQCGLDVSGRNRRGREILAASAVLITLNPPALLGEVDHTGSYEPIDRGALPRVGVIDRVRTVFNTIQQEGNYHVTGTIWSNLTSV
jgi:hypothetical protein